LTDFYNPQHSRRQKLQNSLSLKIPPHLKRVATLLCEILTRGSELNTVRALLWRRRTLHRSVRMVQVVCEVAGGSSSCIDTVRA